MAKIEKKSVELKRTKKKYSPVRLIIAIACILVIIIAAVYLINSFKRISDVKTYDVKFIIGDYVGFNIDPNSLNFGTTIPGGSANRILDLVSDRPLKVHIVVDGAVKNWINISDNNFILDGKKEIGFIIRAPAETPKGNYTGKVTIFFLKP